MGPAAEKAAAERIAQQDSVSSKTDRIILTDE